MTTTTSENVSRSNCPHCGAILEPMRVEALGKIYEIGFIECNCEGTQRERQKEAEAKEKIESAKRRERFVAKLQAAGIPKRYLNAEHHRARDLANSLDKGYYIFGGNGTRKTLLAMAIARNLIALGVDVKVAIVPSLLESMRNRSSEDRNLTQQLEDCEVLILDDLGKESATAYACERLFDIVNRRYNALTPIIVTSNYSLTEVANHLPEGGAGSAIASRLAEITKRIHMDGEDGRLRRG